MMAVLLVAGAAVVAAADLDTSYQNLQDAVKNKDIEAVKKLAAETSAMAREELAKPAGDDADAKQRTEYLHSVDTYADYALFATAVQSEPAVLVDLIAALEQQNPKSKYLDAGYGRYLPALAATGNAAKVPAIAEKAIANFPQNPDLLYYLDTYAANHGQTDRELAFCSRIIALWSSHPKPPENVTEAEWDHARDASLGPAYYMAGMVNAARQRWIDADRNLRAALPSASGNPTMQANALFQLGIANYNIGKTTMSKARILEAVKFSKQASAIPGAVAAQAWKNAQIMQAEADRMR
jgi:tetratricopeptide (TPR) repeat protein